MEPNTPEVNQRLLDNEEGGEHFSLAIPVSAAED